MSHCTYKVSRHPSVRRRLIEASLTLGSAFIFLAATNAISPASALAASQSSTGGTSWYVAPGGTATSCSANSQTVPFSTIEAALACSANGDTVIVAPSGANPYAGFGTVSDDVSIVAGPGGSARTVEVDASNTPLVVGAGADVSVSGFSLECTTVCSSIVTDHGTLALDDDQVNGGGLSGGVLEQAQAGAATELSLVGTTVEATYSAYGGVYSGPTAGATGGRSLVIAGSTIYNNVASSGAGGVSVASSPSSASTATITGSTITDNVGPGAGGVFGPVSLANTIVAGNSSGSSEDDCGSQVTDATGGHNLVGSSTCGLLAAGVNGDQLSVSSPGLGTLADNGGPTDTVALRVGSPAISAGDAATCEAAPISDLDQRGLPRNATTRGTCDIGAYDTGGTALAPAATFYVAPGGTATSCSANSQTVPFSTIEAALACSANGDTVIVAPSGANPYAGFGTVSDDVSIVAGPGGSARTVEVDASNTPLVVGAGADVSVSGFSLECTTVCSSIVTDHGTLALDDDQVNGGGLSGGVLEQAQAGAATELSLVGTTVEATYSAYGGVYSGPTAGATGGRSLVIAGSTIYNNVASSGAGGVSVASSPSSASTATITGSTITDNVGPGAGGVFGPVSLANTIVAGNSSGSSEDDCGSQVTDATGGHNLVGSSTCGLLAAGVNGDQLSVSSPGLGTLADNGGPTDTVALRVGSPAISAGDAATCEAAPISDLDQRGLPRNATTRGTCDIGAYDTGGNGTALTWTVGPSGPLARSAPALATGPSGLTLLFGGGGTGNSFLSDTWELSSPSGTWQQVVGRGPSARTGANVVWDPALSEFVLFGGVSSTGFLSDTWAFNPASSSWSQLSPKGAPTPRAGAALVAEPDGDIVLFGGLTYTGYLADTWVYSPTSGSSASGSWTEEHPTNNPSARYEPAVAASSTGTVVLFGGAGAKGDDADTWSYTLSNDTWAELSPSGTVPPASYGAGLAYDSAAGNFVLADGATAAGYSEATYTFNAGTNIWATLAPIASPSPRAAEGFAYDAPANLLVQFGGWNGSNFLADTWELPG